MPDEPIPAPAPAPVSPAQRPRRVFMLGATGTIGRATVRALLRRGMRWCASCGRAPASAVRWRPTTARGCWPAPRCASATCRTGVAGARRLRGERFDALVSCLASRTGAPKDAWAIDHQAHRACAGRRAGRRRHAGGAAVGDLRAEAAAGLPAGQAGVRAGAHRVGPDLLDRAADGVLQVAVGPGRAGAAGQALPGLRRRHADGLQADQRRRPGRLPGRLPGRPDAPQPGAAHRRAGRGHHTAPAGRAPVRAARAPPRFKQVPVAPARRHHRRAGPAGRVLPGLAAKAELARIGRYYATESMLVLDPRERAATTPPPRPRPARRRCSTTTPRCCAAAPDERGDHAVF
jgi:divinyl chlorophyllide a 8-vinyl-reductase